MSFEIDNILNALLKYVILLTIVVITVGTITTYFYFNLIKEKSEVDINSEFSTLNLYLLKTSKIAGCKIKTYGLVEDNDLNSYYITFENTDGTTNTFVKINDIIYYNKIKICENVEEFKVIVDKSAKVSISVEVQIKDKIFNSQYTMIS